MEQSKMVSGGETLRFVLKDALSGKRHVYRSTVFIHGVKSMKGCVLNQRDLKLGAQNVQLGGSKS